MELLTQLAEIGTLIVGFSVLVFEIRKNRRQANAEVFLKYTERYDEIMRSFPGNAFDARVHSDGALPDPSRELTLAALRYLNLCSEQYYLFKKGYLDKGVWEIWESELKRTLRTPLYLREWKGLRREFESYQEFLKYVDLVQQPTANS